LAKPRCLILFEESCKSERTFQTYLYHIDRFLNWAHKDYESLLFLEKLELTDLLVDYAIYEKKRVSPNSIPLIFAGIFKFLEMNDREFNKRKIRFIFPEKVKSGGERAITDQELIEMVRVASSEKAQALIHVLSATGCRPEGIAELQMKHIEEMPDGCLSLTVYAGSLKEYTTFLHGVATRALKKYHAWRELHGEKLNPESFVFTGTRVFATLPSKQLHYTTIATIISNVMKKANVRRVKTGNRYDLAVCTGIRIRFNTKLKMNSDVSYPIAERFMDHKYRLESHYLKPTKEELFQEYKKAIPDLVFDESEKLRIENKNKQKKIDELESSKVRIAELESRMDTINKHLRELKKED